MNNSPMPGATYRLQFNRRFTFRDALDLAGYLDELGVTHVYSSPLLQSRRGSQHGYDVTDPSRLSRELGTENDFEALSAELEQRGMGLILDIVPNHMAADIENPWWTDVLENGPGSAYASYFDIDWHPPHSTLENKVLLPVLGEPYGRALEMRKLRLVFDEGRFFIRYGETMLPVAPKSYPRILEYRLGDLERALGSKSAAFREFSGILAALAALPERVALRSEAMGERRLGMEEIKKRLARLYGENERVRIFLDENVRRFNGEKGKVESFLRLDHLLREQAYVLAFWRNANEAINYRRFFAVSELVGLRVEDPLVFNRTHSTVLRLVEKGEVEGLRIDHVDGLWDPLAYLRRLRESLEALSAQAEHKNFYVIVEKILSDGEALPDGWPVNGTTGYDFLNFVNRLFVDERGARGLETVYRRFLGEDPVYQDIVYEKKKQVMETLLAVEARALGRQLAIVAEQDRYARELPQEEIVTALIEITACLPVYRTYARTFDLAANERRLIHQALRTARRRNPALNPACFDFVSDVLLLREGKHLDAAQREARLALVMRWQQFTGPVTAKAVEDSAFYVYNRTVSLNEVGGYPRAAGLATEDFHQFIQGRRRCWPHSLNSTTTHDTKRAEDVRARINVLSEIPEDWGKHLARWKCWNEPQKNRVNGELVPCPNEEIFLYQTLVGAWPLSESEVPRFKNRLRKYVIKATREANVHTRWSIPNLQHERALIRFVETLLEPVQHNRFLQDFLPFQEIVAYYGMLNGLSQVLLKMTCPGVPDFYQGSELWDLRLVDPDNRGPVDFRIRLKLLEGLKRTQRQGSLHLVRDMVEHWKDGRIKLYLIARTLSLRKAHQHLFREGDYVPVETSGGRERHVCAFARCFRGTWVLAAVPKFLAGSSKSSRFWQSARLTLPSKAPQHWINVLTDEEIEAAAEARKSVLSLSSLFANFPVALLMGADRSRP
ncbi:MAG: malto-oligosyltrehalose synthase [Terriglobia bacterium]